MKKLLILLALVGALVLTGCPADDEDSEGTTNSTDTNEDGDDQEKTEDAE